MRSKRRSKRKKDKKFLAIFTIFLVILLLVVLYSYSSMKVQEILETKGFVKMEVKEVIFGNESAMVRLRNGCKELDFFVSLDQGSAIEAGLKNFKFYRPMTHDILVNILKGFEIKPLQARIVKLVENTYYGELILQKGTKFLVLDVRPSDAVALALRMNFPIYVNESLVKEVC